MPPRPGDVAERKGRIDAAAVEVIAERGFAAATTAEIASRAEVAEGTIFRHYPTKKALLVGVLGPLARKVIAPLASRSLRKLLKREHASLQAFLEAVFDDRLRLLRSGPPIVRVFLQEASLHPEVRDLAATIVEDNIAGPFRQALDGMKARGWIDAGFDSAIALRFIMSTFGTYFVMRGLLFPDRDWDDEKERAQMVAFLARGLSPREPAR
jgi:AcrR family transcriptional regulator